ncbi:MAG: glycerate kinase family protein [Christensenellales bacterium]
MYVLIAVDSFKGSISAADAARAVAGGLKDGAASLQRIIGCDAVPMADGGEGTCEALTMATGGHLVPCRVTGPLGEPVDAFYGILGDGKTAVVEMAAASGLPLVPVQKRNPLYTTTYGTGELVLAALQAGCKKLIIGIGGSATNDGGLGFAQALGVRFYDENERPLGFGGKELLRLKRIDVSNLSPLLQGVPIQIACDVNNPLCGPDGASATFGPQKGATPEIVQTLDEALRTFGTVVKEQLHKDIFHAKGAGAAGGLGGGILAFLNAEMLPGTEIVIKATDLCNRAKKSDIIITGEGATDWQTMFGKVPYALGQIGRQAGKPVLCICGNLGKGYEQLYDAGITAFFPLPKGPMTFAESMENAKQLLYDRAYAIGRLLSSLS